jgi:SSS family solute:Na+ symporter
VVVLIYVFFGGVRGTTWVNAFQTLIFLSLGLATLWTFSKRMGGFRQATEMVRQYNPDKLRREVRPDDPLTRYKGDFAVYEKKKAEQEARPASATAPRLQAPEPPHGISKLLFLTYGFVPLSVGMFPHLFQHWLTARSARSFRLTLFMHPIMIMIVWLPCVMLGTWATSAMINGQPVIPSWRPESRRPSWPLWTRSSCASEACSRTTSSTTTSSTTAWAIAPRSFPAGSSSWSSWP